MQASGYYDKIKPLISKLRAVKAGGKWRLTEVLKNRKMMFEKMGIGVLFEVNLLIKKDGV